MRSLIFIILVLLTLCTKAQIIFCPPGAEWNYNYIMTAGGAPPPYSYSYVEKIKYVRDSLIGGNLYKVLKHKEFFLECGKLNNGLSLIKQNGDTVFFRNESTNHQWQILYNFNAQPGQSWLINFLSDPDYTIIVNAVNTVTSNFTPLKQLSVTLLRASNFGNTNEGSITITERFGFNGFLFNFFNQTRGRCDTQWFQRFLCYSDNQFGKIQFTEYPCDYVTERVGLKELKNNTSQIHCFPNPFNTEIKIESSELILKYKLMDVFGKILFAGNADNKTFNLKTENLIQGIYFLKVETEKGIITKKIVKE
jgi:hypothetical protein